MLIKITLFYAGILGILLVILSFNVMQNWVRVTGQGHATDRGMRRAERVLSSFIEYVPLALLLITVMELTGAMPLIIHLLGATLVASRLMHAYGSNEVAGAGFMRFLGSQLTFIVLMVASISCIYVYCGRMH